MSSEIMQISSIFSNEKKLKIQQARRVLDQRYIQYADKRMNFQYFLHGQMPQNGYRLVIGLHGGGGVSSSQNDRQWINHQHLYDGQLPDGTIWFVPRSVEDVPDMWWKDYILYFLEKIIQYFSVLGLIHTNKVFLTGYSAGGDGVYHLAGMMADLLAGAAMMAGHPNNAICQNLRNIVFSIQVGQYDNAYDRANWAKLYINKLIELKKEYGGFTQYSQVRQGMSHWMEKKDALVFNRLFYVLRDPYPDFIIFRQHPKMPRKRFYNIQFADYSQGLTCVRSKGNNFWIKSQSKKPIKILVHSKFVNLNKKMKINYNGYETKVKVDLSKRKQVLKRTSKQYLDPEYVFEAQIQCITQTNIPKDWYSFGPSHMKGSSQYQQNLQTLDNIVCNDGKIYSNSGSDAQQMITKIKNTRSKNDKETYAAQNKRYIADVRPQFSCGDTCQIY